jgi:capsular polysaccharide biosynthesis protein
MSDSKYNYTFDLVGVISLCWKWRKTILIVTAVAGLLSIVFSSPIFIKPKYKSVLIFYPTSISSVAGALLDKNSKENILQFGEEEQVEQVLQILESDVIRNKVISKFNLYEHYDIDIESPIKNTQLTKMFNSNVNIKRTEYNAINVSVLDTEPIIAAGIANYIGDLLDSTKNDLQKTKAKEAFEIVKTEYAEKLNYISTINDSLDVLRLLGLYDYESQSVILNERYTEAIADFNDAKGRLEVLIEFKSTPDTTINNTKATINGAKARMGELEFALAILSKYGGKSILFSNELEYEQEKISELKFQYDKARIDYERTLPQKFIINKASVAEKKSYPIRWLICVITVFAAISLSIVALFALEFVKTNSKA